VSGQRANLSECVRLRIRSRAAVEVRKRGPLCAYSQNSRCFSRAYVYNTHHNKWTLLAKAPSHSDRTYATSGPRPRTSWARRPDRRHRPSGASYEIAVRQPSRRSRPAQERACDTSHGHTRFRRVPGCSDLVLGVTKLLELLAGAARLRAEGEHRGGVLLALALVRPIGACDLLVGAHRLPEQSAAGDERTQRSTRARAREKGQQWAAGRGRAASLTAQTPQVLGQSRITAPGLLRHSASPQISHCVAFLSSHVFAWQTSHEPGQVFSVNPGFSWHWPEVAQPGQSLCVSLHSSRHTPHATGQCLSMKLGFSPHAPAAVQPWQSSWTSLHVGVHRPHEVGHALFMKPALLLQSPCFAHAAHDTSVSSHVSVHVAHECGQSTERYSALAPVHSPSLAQAAQDVDLSLQ